MGIDDVNIIGVGKDEFNGNLEGMINGRILPWVEDVEENGYPVWQDYGAVQRSTYFLDRDGNLIYQFNITTLDPDNPADYNYLINMILDYRGNNGPDVIRVTQDYPTIQSAIDNSSDGDIIIVDPGTFTGQINFLDKNITLSALIYSGYDENNIEKSILDGNNQGTVVTINGGQDQSTILIGFTIQNGNSNEYGGGILIEDSSPVIDRNIIQGNSAGSCGGAGGGIAIIGDSYPHIFTNEIYNNSVSGDCDCYCYFGGGIYVDTPSWPILGGSITLGNVLYGNTADNGRQLFRDHSADTSSWTPIYAHHNYFQFCPPESSDVYPLNGWDLDNCHSITLETDKKQIYAEQFILYPNYPNPFNPLTKIKFNITEASMVDIIVYDILGNIIMRNNIYRSEGAHIVEWNASEFSSGIYFIKLVIGVESKIQKAIFVK